MDASDTTNSRKRRTLFANRIEQQTSFNKGWTNRIILEGGVHTGVGAMTFQPNFYNMREGALVTSGAERDAIVAGVPNKFPNPPTGVTAALIAGDVVVSFTPPVYRGVTPITSYAVVSNPGGVRVTGASSPITMTGLTPGIIYTFTVIATNASGNSDPSAPSNAVAAGTVPDAPTAVSGTPGNTQVTIRFTLPAFDGGLPILDYTFTAYVSGSSIGTIVGSGSPTIWAALTNGTAYTFTVKARNELGFSAESAPSAPVTPATVPGAPTSVVGTPGNASASVAFTPGGNGGSAILDYTVTAYSGASPVGTSVGSASPITITGLINDSTYTFTVKARNPIGYSLESSASDPVTLPTVPGVPTNFAVAPGVGSVKLYFTAPSNGGLSITNYMYSTDDGASFIYAGITTSPITISGVSAGISYNFKLKAVNDVGPGNPTAALEAAGLGVFNPNDIAGINLWLDSQVPASVTTSGGRVTAMADQSSAGNNFAASGTGTIAYDFPSGINGRPALNFTTSYPAAQTYLNKLANLAPTNQLSVCFVVRQTGRGSAGNSELFFTRNDFRYCDIFNRTNSDGILCSVVGSFTATSTGVDILTTPPTNAIVSFITDSTTDMYVNGETTLVSGITRGGLSLNNNLDWCVSGAAFLGNYGEILCFSTPLDDTQRQAVEGYLAWKWGMQGDLSGGHPYYRAPPSLALPAAPTALVATAGDASASIEFTEGSDGGTSITNYQYSINNGSTFTAFSPAQTTTPVSISGLSNGTAYNVKLKAVTAFGVSAASSAVSVTPVQSVTGSPRVLILGDAQAAGLATALQSAKTDMGYAGTMEFTVKDVFGANSAYAGTDITTDNYDVVILYTNGGSTPTLSLGLNLNIYVSNGGKFIMCVFAWGNVTPFPNLTYAEKSTYGYVGTQSYIGSQVTTVGSPHPILSGINGTTAISGSYTSGLLLTPGTTDIARYSDNTYFLAVREPGAGAKLVGMNIYPGITWSTNSDKNILRYLLNSIYWCIGSLV